MTELQKIEFLPYPKTPRLYGNKEIIVTEKIDGTNAAIQIIPLSNLEDPHLQEYKITAEAHDCVLVAQSRNRIITPTVDNAGFAKWVSDNAEKLVELLGVGVHRGEWWGQGIQRGYGLKEKRFSLFNTFRHGGLCRGGDGPDHWQNEELPNLGIVPELWHGTFDTTWIDLLVRDLVENGSKAAPGFKAEGVIVFHEASGHIYKVMCENDQIAKGPRG
jgi:hypothetical protein